jgi:hypothetical protein
MKKVFFKKFFDFYTIDEYLDFADKSQSVNLILGFDDFSLLDEVGPIDKLIITSGDASTAHYDALYRHSEIKGLSLDYYEDESFSPWTVDLSFFPDLRILNSNSSLNFCNIMCEKKLRGLFVKEWHEATLDRIMGCNLESLVVLNGLKNIDGYENNNLHIFSLSYSSIDKIHHLSNLNSLEVLEVDHCPRICDWSDFRSSSLKILLMLGNNRIDSIDFIVNLPNLKALVFEGTIGNGDIKSLKRLERCALTPHKRFYNVSQKELAYPQNYKTSLDVSDDVNWFSHWSKPKSDNC